VKMNIIPRSDWAPGKTGSNGKFEKILGLVAHWPGDGIKTYSHDRQYVIDKLRGYRSYHVNSRGWVDIGYNFAIDMAGRIWEGRGWRNVGAHAASNSNPRANRRYYGVIFLIGADQKLSQAAIDAFWELQAEVVRRNPGATQVLGHGSVPGAATSCPGPAVRAMLAAGSKAVSKPAQSKPAPAKPAPSKPSPGKGKIVGPGYDFPLPKGYYFGPKEQGVRSRSGYFPKVFSGKTDRQWLIEFGKQLARRGWNVGKGKTWLRGYGNNGYYGPEYRALIRKFQENMGLKVDSALGVDTWNAAFKQPIK